jgi:hypothetical protein
MMQVIFELSVKAAALRRRPCGGIVAAAAIKYLFGLEQVQTC